MPIKLNNKYREPLIKAIADGIPKVNVQNGNFADSDTMVGAFFPADDALPQSGPLREELETYLGERPMFNFLTSMVDLELTHKHKWVTESPELALSELDGFKDPEAKARDLVNELESLPWKYTLSIELPPMISLFKADFMRGFSISEGINVSEKKELLDKNFPIKNEQPFSDFNEIANAFLQEPKRKSVGWKNNISYMQIEVEGFVDPYGTTPAARQTISNLRSILGLGLAKQILVPERYTLFIHRSRSSYVLVHKNCSHGMKYESKFSLNDNYAQAIRTLNLSLGQGLSDPEKVIRLQGALTAIGHVVSAGAQAEKIMLAAQWLFDSYAVNDELLSFVQTMVVLEILLGKKQKKDAIGLGELIGNRCAYLIADSHQERAVVLRDFKRIYDVRSEIVHSGKSHLSSEERFLFGKLRSICHRVIEAEQKLLHADLKRTRTDRSS